MYPMLGHLGHCVRASKLSGCKDSCLVSDLTEVQTDDGGLVDRHLRSAVLVRRRGSVLHVHQLLLEGLDAEAGHLSLNFERFEANGMETRRCINSSTSQYELCNFRGVMESF